MSLTSVTEAAPAAPNDAVQGRTAALPVSAMPQTDKWVWFAGAPLCVLVLAFAFNVPRAYRDPLYVLFDLWLVVAIISWLTQRPYRAWAVKWRWTAVALWALQLVVAAQGPRDGSQWVVQCDVGGKPWMALVERYAGRWRDIDGGGEVLLPDTSRCAFREWHG